jgi:hypothetical protein
LSLWLEPWLKIRFRRSAHRQAVHEDRRPIFGHYPGEGGCCFRLMLGGRWGGSKSQTPSSRTEQKHRPFFPPPASALPNQEYHSYLYCILVSVGLPKCRQSLWLNNKGAPYNITTRVYPCCSLFFIPSSLAPQPLRIASVLACHAARSTGQPTADHLLSSVSGRVFLKRIDQVRCS